MSLAETIIEKIQNSHLVPLSKDRVKRKKYLLLLCLCLLLGLGAFIVSFFISDTGGIIEFVELDTLYMIFVWIMVILGLGFIIYRDSRNIGRLYRYSMKKILGIILIIMILGGLILHISRGDIAVQNFLIKHTRYEAVMSTYQSWNKPEEGRLIGEVEKASRDGFIIKDMTGRIWTVQISDAGKKGKNKHFHGALEEGNTVKVTGSLQENGVFLAQDVAMLFE